MSELQLASSLGTSALHGVVTATERLGHVVWKSGVSTIAKALSVEWARHRVRVNAIGTGYVRTPFVEDLQVHGQLDSGAFGKRTPMGPSSKSARLPKLPAS